MELQEIYTAHHKMVYNLALSYIQNIEDAEEITQDVFVAVHQSLSTFQEKSSLSTWMYRITINKSLDFIKAKKSKKRFAFLTTLFYPETNEAREELGHFNHPGVLMEQKESMKNIFDAINELPPNQKTALILSKLEFKSQQEIGEIMDLSSKAVESLVQRAKSNLLKKLNQTKD